MKKIFLVIVSSALIVVVSLGSFYFGMRYQQGRMQPKFGQFQARGDRQGLKPGGQTSVERGLTQPVNGEILSSDEKSFTVRLRDGSSKVVLLTDSTIINKSVAAKVSDLVSGGKVMVLGTQNSDGSILASSIHINTGGGDSDK
jgi:hypothetical protein